MPETDLSFADFNALGQAINDTWGKSSTVIPGGSVKFLLYRDSLVVTYHCIGTFSTSYVPEAELKKYLDEAHVRTNDAVKRVKTEFKETTGKALKLKEKSSEPSLNVIGVQPHVSSFRRIHYKLVTVYEMSV